MRRKADPIAEAVVPHEAPRSLIASAARVKLDGLGWKTYKFGNDEWQTEAWRLYDIIGELRFVANWIGSACSRVRIYVAEVDDNGRVQKEATNKKVAGLADTLFGGPPSKAEALRMLGINLTVAGDAFIVGRGTDDPDSDEWYIVSSSELRRWGGTVSQLSPDGTREQLNPNKDLIIRVWTPHPRRNLWADSPTRAALPMLWEIERLTRYVFAQIDSRLVSAGLMPIPKEVSFPDEDADLPGAEQLTARLMRTGSASLKGDGTAAGVVPTFVEMPTEALGKIELIQFASELSKQALELRAEALRRFALAMDIDPSILSGAGEANHWGAWQIMEGQINIHIVPLMTRICDALTTAYLQPALKAVKEDPEKYVFWYDTAPLTVRPERLKDTLQLFEKGIASRAAVLLSGNYKISDAPELAEDLERFTRELMLRDPNLFQIPQVRQIAGYTEEILPATTVVTPQLPAGAPGAGPPPPPAPPTGIQPTAGPPIPAESVAQNNPAGPPPPPSGVTAAMERPAVKMRALNEFMVANATVLRAMERAGKKMLDRSTVGKFPDTPSHELHTKIALQDRHKAAAILEGSWDQMPVLAAAVSMPNMDVQRLQSSLQAYCVELLTNQQPHDVNLLANWLAARGFLNGLT